MNTFSLGVVVKAVEWPVILDFLELAFIPEILGSATHIPTKVRSGLELNCAVIIWKFISAFGCMTAGKFAGIPHLEIAKDNIFLHFSFVGLYSGLLDCFCDGIGVNGDTFVQIYARWREMIKVSKGGVS